MACLWGRANVTFEMHPAIMLDDPLMSRTPIHPGTISGEELAEIGISAAELARQLKIPTNRVTQIISGRRNVTADTALRLGKWFGTSAVFWLNLQKSYELRLAQKKIGKALKEIPSRNHEMAQAT